MGNEHFIEWSQDQSCYYHEHRLALPHPFESMLVRARTVTVSGACLALTNILNKVYSERSCLTCVLNNKETKALGYSNEK